MGGDHTKVFCFEIDGDGKNNDWAHYSNLSVITAHQEDLASSDNLLTQLDVKDVFRDTFVGDQFAAKRPGINALDLYFSPAPGDTEIVCAFKIASQDDNAESDPNLVFDTDQPFLIGDNGWAEPASTAAVYCSPTLPHWAAFRIDMHACRRSAAYQTAKNKREFPFVRFPIAFRLFESNSGLPVSMLPNTHSLDDIGRFGHPGQLRLAEMQEHLHSHNPRNNADNSNEREKRHAIHQKTDLRIQRHWGPHFASVYSVYLRLD